MKVRVTYGQPQPAVSTPDAPPPRWGWENLPHPEDATQLHLVPLLDIYSHCWNPPCPCGARPDAECGDRLIHHIAFDGRNAYETGERKHH